MNLATPDIPIHILPLSTIKPKELHVKCGMVPESTSHKGLL